MRSLLFPHDGWCGWYLGLFRADVAGLRPGHKPEVLLDEAQAHKLLLHALYIQPARVVAVVVLDARDVLAALLEELVVVQVARVAGNAVVVPHVYRTGHLLPGHQRLVELLAVTGTYDPDFGLAVSGVDFRVYLLQRLGQGGKRSSRGLLHEQVAVVAVLEGVYHEVHRVVKGHHEARHVRICYRYRLALHHLLHPQRYHAAAAGHHVAVARAADGRGRALAKLAPLGYRHLLHQGFGDAHRVDGVCCLIGGEHDYILDTMFYGREKHVLGALDVGARGLHREELARGHLFEGCRREHVVHAAHGDVHRLLVAHVADIELDLGVLQPVTHVVLLLLVAGEDADLPDVAVQEAAEDCVAEAARTAGDQEYFIFKNTHILITIMYEFIQFCKE